MEKEMTAVEKLAELKDNLCRITGDGSLVKLDMINEKDLRARSNFLASNGRTAEAFNSALFIYFCNVLDGMVGGHYSERKDIIRFTAEALLTAYLIYDYSDLHEGYLERALNDIFDIAPRLDREHAASVEDIAKIEADFGRLNNVWKQKFVIEKE